MGRMHALRHSCDRRTGPCGADAAPPERQRPTNRASQGSSPGRAPPSRMAHLPFRPPGEGRGQG
eukprot:scaffold111112_cov72-Phaeocystis_antarctica.AAC.1